MYIPLARILYRQNHNIQQIGGISQSFDLKFCSVCMIRSKNDLKMHAQEYYSIFRMSHTHHNYLLESSHLLMVLI